MVNLNDSLFQLQICNLVILESLNCDGQYVYLFIFSIYLVLNFLFIMMVKSDEFSNRMVGVDVGEEMLLVLF